MNPSHSDALKPRGSLSAMRHLRPSPHSFLEPLESRTLLNAAFDLIGLTAARADARFSQFDGRGVAVAVLDAGVDPAAPQLGSGLLASMDFIQVGSAASHHGTEVASVIGARNPQIGVAPRVGLLSVRVISEANIPVSSQLVPGLQWVLDHRQQYNIVAVNMSLGDNRAYTQTPPGDPYVTLIRQLEAAGVAVISAAGNEFFQHPVQGVASPAVDSTLAVGAVWSDNARQDVVFSDGAEDFTTAPDRITSFSDRWASSTFILAPGADVPTESLNAAPVLVDGTSFSAPIVSGAVALLQNAAQVIAGHLLAPADIVRILDQSASQVVDGDDESDNVPNTGLTLPRLNVFHALELVAQQLAPPTVNAVAATFTPSQGSTGGADAVMLTATGVASSFGTVSRVDFFIDLNRDGVLEPEELIGSSNTAASTGTYRLEDPVPGTLAPGVYVIGARASSSLGIDGPITQIGTLLKPDLPFTITYPEGWANQTTINEFVPLTNPNSVTVQYRVIAHYESGPAGTPLDTIIDQGSIPPLSRAGITVSTRDGSSPALVALNRGYSLEVQSSLPVGAILSHYDNFDPANPAAAVAAGAAFTPVAAQAWTFAQVQRTPGRVNDFLLFYNASDTDATLTITFDTGGVQALTTTVPVRARGRAGLAINDLMSLAPNFYGAVVSADQPIVAALSHYVTDGTGDTTLGVPTPLGGALPSTGTFPFIDRSPGLFATVALFNPGASAISVTLTAATDNPIDPVSTTTLQVPAFTLISTDLAWVRSGNGRPLSIVFDATGPLAATLFQPSPSRGDSTVNSNATDTATAWAFADGFLNRTLAGTDYLESLNLYNPTSNPVSVTLDFFLYDFRSDSALDGQSRLASQTITIPAGRLTAIALHDPLSPVLQGASAAGPTASSVIPFSTLVRSDTPILASFVHWDLLQGGGWSTIGTPIDAGVLG